METQGAIGSVKPQLKCFGRRNRSKPPKDVSQDASAFNGKLDPADIQVGAEQASVASPPGSEERGLAPGESARESAAAGVETRTESGENAEDDAELGSPVACVEAAEVLEEAPEEIAPRFRSEEEQVAYEDHIMYRAHEIWTRQEASEHKRIPSKWKEPPHEKTHWDFVIEEMTWLAKDFDKERKWKLASAKRLAQKASKARTELDVKGLRRIKSEEQRTRRIASNIAKEVKKFWVKIEKLVVYKHQLAVDEKKKKALDKHLSFLLGQTERYSSMLAVNLASAPDEKPPEEEDYEEDEPEEEPRGLEGETNGGVVMADEDFVCDRIEEEDDEATLEADEALITADERKEELNALERESELPLEELLRLYSRDASNGDEQDAGDEDTDEGSANAGGDEEDAGDEGVHADDEENASLLGSDAAPEEADDDLEYSPNKASEADEDDERTFNEEEKLAISEGHDALSELEQLKEENELPVSELLARYRSMQVQLDSPEADDKQPEASEPEPELEPEIDDNGDDSTSEARERMGEPSTSGRTPVLIIQDSKHTGVENFPDGTELEAQVLANITRAAQQRGQRMKKRAEKEEVKTTGRKELDEAAAAAQSAQPTGYTFSTTRVRTKLPFLLKHSLREYQHIGLDWLVTMYEKRLNGILADEMGLGKTIMTIALLAHLACEKGIWGPHLIVVPTSVMLNWETEFMKWCPAFKLLTYFGSAKERKVKRQGWSKANSFHICITTYRLVIQDAKAFKRKKWKYLILDEAHLIKNWKSQRWQMLLNFNSKRRILLTGTPLQNDLMELWSLMHFLMPHVFQSHQEFKDWFSNPITGMIEGQERVNHDVVDRLHNVLRPFLLRRLKRDVEKQLPGKHEHVVPCGLSKRQRNLYEDFMASSDTQATLSSGNFLGLINVLMQLRKVCNHPDLFESRPIVSSFDMPGLELQFCSEVCSVVLRRDFSRVDLRVLGLFLAEELDSWEACEIAELATPRRLIEEIASTGEDSWDDEQNPQQQQPVSIFDEIQAALRQQRLSRRRDLARHQGWLNILRCSKPVLYGSGFRRAAAVEHPVYDIHSAASDPSRYLEFSSGVAELVKLPSTRCEELSEILQAFVFVIPAARAPPPIVWCSRGGGSDSFLEPEGVPGDRLGEMSELLAPLRPIIVRRQLFFPDRRLLQFDCGKLQALSVLLRRLKSEGHRALIFTQMTKMLDILESFINLYGYTYMRLDGSTKPEQRQILMQRFNTNPKIFLFILSTRSGGVGINLVGADTVIFYDSDWNPAMDQQAQDRCHRIGQTREVNIYRLVSESTIEENILKKANQKRFLDDLVIQSGGYNTEFLFKKLDPMELLAGAGGSSAKPAEVSKADVDAALKSAEDEADYEAMKNAELEEEAGIQEFAEDVSVEDDGDDLEDGKAEGKAPENENNNSITTTSNSTENNNKSNAPAPEPEKELGASAAAGAPAFMDAEEEMDMLADVKQLAAAAAASGRGSTYFEDQLKPIERYAIRFMDLWDPIIDSTALETEVAYEEKEWELEQLEKLKEEQEAEIDEDDEPLVYESWDTSHADAAYRQEVEALTQQQELMQAEWEAMQEEEMENAARIAANQEKKAKKKKFKLLGKGSLGPEGVNEAADGNETHEVEVADEAGEILSGVSDDDMMMMDYDMQWPLLRPAASSALRKRKQPEEWGLENEGKRFKGSFASKPSVFISIKRPFILLERDKKKDSLKSRSGEDWTSEEDIVLCAVANEYGGNWRLATDALQGIPEGGIYCGQYKHPGKCKDRFKHLVTENACGDVNNISSSTIKVTEEDSKRLLRIVERVPDQDRVLQRHFASILKTKEFCGSKAPAAAGASSAAEPRNPLFIPLAELNKGALKPPVTDASKKQGIVLLAEALRSSEQVNNGKVVEQAKPATVIRETVMELTLNFPDRRDYEDYTPLSLILREEPRPRLVPGPSSAVRAQPVIETRYRKASELAPEKFAASAFPAALKPPVLQPPAKRQAPPNDLAKAQKAKQAKQQQQQSSASKNGMVEIRPVEVKNLSFSPSQLKPANLKKPPLFNPVRVHTITTQGNRGAPQSPQSNFSGGKSSAAGSSPQPQQQASFAQYWRPDCPQPGPASRPGSNPSRPAPKPVHSRFQNHSPQGQQQQQQQRQLQTPQQLQQRQMQMRQHQLQQQQQQHQHQPQQNSSSSAAGAASQAADVSLSLSLAPPGPGAQQQGAQRRH